MPKLNRNFNTKFSSMTLDIKSKFKQNLNKNNEQTDQDESVAKLIQFKSELIWCQEFIREEYEKTKNEKRKESLSKAYRSLMNEKNPMIQKRQIMSQFCGDYRKSMLEEISKSLCSTTLFKIENVSRRLRSNEINDNLIKYTVIRKHSKQINNLDRNSSSDFKFQSL
ncbi:hypothetical protein NH340_JMT02594 [Sarcoptes scabiei]|nr:hypothetical protein NH340_JMT02594 [Sarcoptes scabiei]